MASFAGLRCRILVGGQQLRLPRLYSFPNVLLGLHRPPPEPLPLTCFLCWVPSFNVNTVVAQELRSCFKFLVPFSPKGVKLEHSQRSPRRLLALPKSTVRSQREVKELIWWPPERVLELACLAVDSGGEPAAIHRPLDPTIIPEFACSLTFVDGGLISQLEALSIQNIGL